MRKMCKQQGLLSKVGKYLNLYTKSFLYKLLMEPHSNFSSNVLYSLPGYPMKDLKKNTE